MGVRGRRKSTRVETDADREWRRKVRARDGNRCRRCGKTGYLHCHHIKRWANYPQLRTVVSNGILLCKSCHAFMTGNEAMYEALCLALLLKPPPT